MIRNRGPTKMHAVGQSARYAHFTADAKRYVDRSSISPYKEAQF